MEGKPLLTTNELAEFFKVPKKTIYHWVSRTKIPYIKAGKHLRFDCGKVLKFFEELASSKRSANPCLVTAFPLKSSSFDCSLKTRRDAAHSSGKE